MSDQKIRPRYIDIHSHLNFPDFDKDRREAAERAEDAGVWMINVGTSAKTSAEVVHLADKHEGMYAIVGLHPIYTSDIEEEYRERDANGKLTGKVGVERTKGEVFDPAIYRKLLEHPKVVGIGECGLDLFHIPGASDENSPLYKEALKRQHDAFRGQIELAIEYKKPIMIHARESYKEILSILDEYLMPDGPQLTGNAHFFAGTVEEARAFLDRGFTLSFTGVITFAKQYEELIRYVPLDRMMSETDCPYVAPVPHRGKRNEPAFVVEVAKKIAEIKGEPLEKVQKALVDNAFRSFKL